MWTSPPPPRLSSSVPTAPFEPDKRIASRGKEPSRLKTHWDYVLEEMAWLAKDFESERKLKLSQAKKVAVKVSKSRLSNEAKGQRRQKEEEQRIRRVAGNIAKDVKKFWTKIEKLVIYKHQLELEGRKRKALDKHLDFLVGQTERYSTMLAEILADAPMSGPENPLPLPPPTSAYDDETVVDGTIKKASLHLDRLSFPPNAIDSAGADTKGQKPTDSAGADMEGQKQVDSAGADMEGQKQVDSAGADMEEKKLIESASSEMGGQKQIDSAGVDTVGQKKLDSTDLEGQKQMDSAGADSEGQKQIPGTDMERQKQMDSVGAGMKGQKQMDSVGAGMKGQKQMDTAGADTERQKQMDSAGAGTKGQKQIKSGRVQLKSEKEDEDADFSLESAEEMEDDFSTLEADEALITEEERREELLALEREGSLPLEELLKLYGARQDLDGSGSEEEDEDEDENEDEDDAEDVDKDEGEDEDGTGVAEDAEEGEAKVQVQARKEPEVSDIPTESREDTGCNKLEEGKTSGYNIVDAAAAAQSAQPTGFTFSTTKVRTKLPFLLKHSLREYQHIGLDWLVTMYEKRLNGILADEMGLGKTIMTIALLAHLACDKGIWGPHLIVVPTSVMLNWETEFMKWCPAFKILTYFGSAKERKVKRQGWSKLNSFHVCITTYRLVIQDAKAFKRKKWKYLILDEAHLIKNWKSQRWQTLLNFNSKRRILLTGTPLQNDLMELWSLMHFLMPHVFQSHQEFRDWFSNPITGMIEGQEQINKELVDRLHNVLRPFILRRLKQDVEKQLPKKYEHVIRCRLSKRQRNLYEDFMASSDTQATLSSGNFLGLINVLMQLRKVCNHPDLFEGRPIISSFDMPGTDVHLSTAVSSALSGGVSEMTNLVRWNLLFSQLEFEMSAWEADEVKKIATPARLIEEIGSSGEDSWNHLAQTSKSEEKGESIIEEIQKVLREQRIRKKQERIAALVWLNALWCNRTPLYGLDFRKQVSVEHPVYDIHRIKANPSRYMEVSSTIAGLVQLPSTRCERLMDLLQAFVFAIPAARSPPPVAWCGHPASSNVYFKPGFYEDCKERIGSLLTFLRPVLVRRQLFFPDRRLLQFDCGKLQQLAVLLRRLRSEGHRALIFTQMTKMLDVLESFVNLHGYTYLRLDGSTKPEQRQILMQRFNTNPKIFLFILSTRSGGVGVNLVGADTVIFYDSDWNPAMDQQAQDRCHRIGQTREVHIYRLISESTIEENILKKANQKRILDDLVIQSGSYNTEFFKKLDPMELLSGLKGVPRGKYLGAAPGIASEAAGSVQGSMHELSTLEVEAALKNAEDEADYMALKKVEQEEAAENQEFTEEGFAGNLDEDECADDLDEGKVFCEKGLQVLDGPGGPSKSEADDGLGVVGSKDIAVINTDLDEDMDMLADVKQMAAAAAAAGHGNVSFDDQLCPVERYAMQFLELWDPVIDKDAIETQVAFEETEWELDRLEKLKQEQEAEIDEDNEPLFYESWDTSFADEAYRQQVEVLAQQEYQRQREWEKMEEEMEDAERAEAEAAAAMGISNLELKNKLKKTKFKSLKKGSLAGRHEFPLDSETDNVNDADWQSPDMLFLSLPCRGPSQRKRKIPRLLEEEMLIEIHKKKMRKDLSPFDKGKSRLSFEGDASESGAGDSDSVVMLLDSSLPVSDNAKKFNLSGGMSVFGMPQKKGPLVKLEKERKKDGIRSRERIPPADPWMPAEDAVFCAVVHEYGGNWRLASETLAGIPDGGIYRGRYRHPVHCRERFRQLLAQNTSITATREPSNEKGGPTAASNAQLKVTEEHIRQLLEAVQQLPDEELLLQRHFVAVLTSVGFHGAQYAKGYKNASFKPSSSPHGPPFIPLPKATVNLPGNTLPSKGSTINEKKTFPPGDLVAAALAQLGGQDAKDGGSQSVDVSRMTGDKMLELKSTKAQVSVNEQSGTGRDHLVVSIDFSETADQPCSFTIPQPVLVTIPDLGSSSNNHHRLNSAPANSIRRSSRNLIEQRYRMACKMNFDGEGHRWAAAAGTGLGIVGGLSTGKGQTSGKRRLMSEPGKASEQKQSRPLKVKKKGKAQEINLEVQENNLESQAGDVSCVNGVNEIEVLNTHLKSNACEAAEVSTVAISRRSSQVIPEMVDGAVNDSNTSVPATSEKQSFLGTPAQMSGCTSSSIHEGKSSDASGRQPSISPSSSGKGGFPGTAKMVSFWPGNSTPGVDLSFELFTRSSVDDLNKVSFRENVTDVAVLGSHRGQPQHHESECQGIGHAVKFESDAQSSGGTVQFCSSLETRQPQTTASELLTTGLFSTRDLLPPARTLASSDSEPLLPQILQTSLQNLPHFPVSHGNAIGQSFASQKVFELPTTTTNSTTIAPSGHSLSHHQ